MKTAIGLMSGTSLDGIDAAIIKTDGKELELTEHFVSVPYQSSFKDRIRQVLGSDIVPKDLEYDITVSHDAVVKLLLEQAKLQPGDVDVIGFHGQTIFHDPDKGTTVQVGDGKLLSEMTGISVINDFRVADMRAGGQGAPLVPIFHAALFKGYTKPLAVLNIGGVANITYISADDEKIGAFDTGPGNALIDDWVDKLLGEPYDEGGKLAASGAVNEAILNALMSHKYFDKTPPKSIDRNLFSADPISSLSPEDGAATLTAFTVKSIAKAADSLKKEPLAWYVMGGGRHNKYMMQELDKLVDGDVVIAEDIGLNGDAIEAQAFAFLAVRSMSGLYITMPSTTGARFEATGGVFYQA